jgi:hypothetical protein
MLLSARAREEGQQKSTCCGRFLLVFVGIENDRANRPRVASTSINSIDRDVRHGKMYCTTAARRSDGGKKKGIPFLRPCAPDVREAIARSPAGLR